LAVQFMIAMAMVLPPVSAMFSARELAEHFNRLGHLPPRLLIVEGRIGSLAFYLDPQIRAGLNTEQLRQMRATELPRLRPGDVIAVPECKVPELRAHLDIDRDPCESIGAYRLYRFTK
jgi:hypothetical protein